jgi:hypothetical protein
VPEPEPEPEPEEIAQPSRHADRYVGMNDFEHERLDVYRAAIEFLVVADEIATSLPKGRAYLVDQLRRAATSIALNRTVRSGAQYSEVDEAAGRSQHR